MEGWGWYNAANGLILMDIAGICTYVYYIKKLKYRFVKF